MIHMPFPRADYFCVSVQTGAIAAGMSADGQLLQFRWDNANYVAAVTEVAVTGMYATTAFAAGAIKIEMVVGRAYTADGSGGTALEFGGDSNVDNTALRTTFADSRVDDFRVSTTAALTAGTQVLEANALGQITTHSSGGVGAATPIIGSIYLPTTMLFEANREKGHYPLVLEADEGFVVRATVPGTGVWTIGFRVRWAEVDATFL